MVCIDVFLKYSYILYNPLSNKFYFIIFFMLANYVQISPQRFELQCVKFEL
jgi:hypothetical protein